MNPRDKRIIGFLFMLLVLVVGGTVYAAVPHDTLRTTPAGVTTQVVDFLNFTNALDQGIQTRIDSSGNANFTTIDTGQGAYEIYANNQDLETTDDVDFNSVNVSYVRFQSSLSNATFSGEVIDGTAGEKLWFGQSVYLKSDGKYYLADANSSSTMPCVCLCAQTSIAADASGDFLLRGSIKNDKWNWTIGDYLYTSGTAGSLTQTAPNTTGDQVQRIGYAYATDALMYSPGDYTEVEIT